MCSYNDLFISISKQTNAKDKLFKPVFIHCTCHHAWDTHIFYNNECLKIAIKNAKQWYYLHLADSCCHHFQSLPQKFSWQSTVGLSSKGYTILAQLCTDVVVLARCSTTYDLEEPANLPYKIHLGGPRAPATCALCWLVQSKLLWRLKHLGSVETYPGIFLFKLKSHLR